MPKIDSTPNAEPQKPARPRIGQVIKVRGVAGRSVLNNEFGTLFDEKQTVPVTVTARILRLLDDGDIVAV